MTLGVGVWAMPFDAQGVDFVREAERMGVDSVWVPEFWAFDALTPLGYLAASTSTIRLGHGHRATRRAHAGDARDVGACRSRRCRADASSSGSEPAGRR